MLRLQDAQFQGFFSVFCQFWRTSISCAPRELRQLNRTLKLSSQSLCGRSRMPSQESETSESVSRPRSRSRSPLERKMPSSELNANAVLRFAKLSENATTPTRGSALAAGYDLYSAHNVIVPAKGREVVKTDIQIAVPDGCYGRVAPRSGLAVKHFIDVGAGVVDQDYRGNVGVVLFNFSSEDFKVSKGDRIAQLVCERICYPDLEELPALDETERGGKGYGSTGK